MTLYDIPGVGQLPAGVPFTMSLQFTDMETGEPFIDHVKFPANFLQYAEPEDFERLGITVVPPPPPPEPEPEDDPPSEEPPA